MALQILSFIGASSTSRSGKKMSLSVFMLKEYILKSTNIQAPCLGCVCV